MIFRFKKLKKLFFFGGGCVIKKWKRKIFILLGLGNIHLQNREALKHLEQSFKSQSQSLLVLESAIRYAKEYELSKRKELKHILFIAKMDVEQTKDLMNRTNETIDKILAQKKGNNINYRIF